ncbi:hypothetical protein MMC12_005330 [Toensbergia leucococca]|nr:hypothetical protein [Toensbergia leucococca]
MDRVRDGRWSQESRLRETRLRDLMMVDLGLERRETLSTNENAEVRRRHTETNQAEAIFIKARPTLPGWDAVGNDDISDEGLETLDNGQGHRLRLQALENLRNTTIPDSVSLQATSTETASRGEGVGLDLLQEHTPPMPQSSIRVKLPTEPPLHLPIRHQRAEEAMAEDRPLRELRVRPPARVRLPLASASSTTTYHQAPRQTLIGEDLVRPIQLSGRSSRDPRDDSWSRGGRMRR